jgi:hypothetical protein
MARYQGLDRNQLIECAERIKTEKLTPEKAEEYGDEKILDKAARLLQARMRTSEKEKAAKAEAKAPEPAEKAVVPVEGGDYVPEGVMQIRDYVQTISVINPKTDFYLNPQTERQTLSKRGLDKVAVAMRIHTEIKDIKILGDRIIVVVRGWIGDKENPDVYTEDAADFVYTDKHNDYIFQQVEKGKILLSQLHADEDGKLWISEDVKDAAMRNIYIRKVLQAKKTFAMRATVSTARERVIRTLSGTCDLNDQEAKMLEEEYRQVAGVRA